MHKSEKIRIENPETRAVAILERQLVGFRTSPLGRLSRIAHVMFDVAIETQPADQPPVEAYGIYWALLDHGFSPTPCSLPDGKWSVAGI